MMDFPRPKYFIGLINSRVGWKLIDQHIDKLDKGGYMMQKAMVEQLPIPDPLVLDDSIVKQIEKLVETIINKRDEDLTANTDAIEAEIDHLVYKIYDLTSEEISFVEASANEQL